MQGVTTAGVETGMKQIRMVFTQPEGAPSADVLGVLPRRASWARNTKGEWTVRFQMPYPDNEQGACYDMEDPPHLQDRPTNDTVAEAKAMCEQCPIVKQCAAWGVAHEEFYVFGGLTAAERREVRKRLGVSILDPTRGVTFGLNEDFHHEVKRFCERGHGVGEGDLVRVNNLADDPYRHEYRVRCQQCHYERYESNEGRERQREKGRKGQAALIRNGTRNTGKANKWGAA